LSDGTRRTFFATCFGSEGWTRTGWKAPDAAWKVFYDFIAIDVEGLEDGTGQ